MNNKKVSILIPTYNGEKYIKETIDSCLNQTYPNIEIIVIDDCSIDNTVNILKQYDKEIKLYLNEQNQGISKNVNKGVDLLTGEYFILLGHDDLLSKDHVKIMVNEFDNNTVSVCCNSILINSLSEEFGLLLKDKVQIKKFYQPLFFLSMDNFINSCGMIHKTEIFRRIKGWDERFRNYGEWLYYIKSLKYGKISYTMKIKSKYRRHDTNITNTFKELNVKKELEEYFLYSREFACKSSKFNRIKFLKRKLMLLKLYISKRIKDLI